MTAVLVIVALAALYAGFHAGHAHANRRWAQTTCHRTPSLWLSARGPWISVPGPFNTRIGHRL